METTTALIIPEIAGQLDQNVLALMGNDNAKTGFERAYMVAYATAQLKIMLTDEYMKPIMDLQGTRLGFKCDKVYPMETVKNCLIEAVLSGVQPSGNQFNIIAGNTYITKEGYQHLLSKIDGLKYQITFELPRIKDTSAAVVATVKWSMFDGPAQSQKIDLPIKVNAHMGADAVIGKATRKARAWLHANLTGSEMGDGDVTDTESTVVSSAPLQKSEEELEQERKMVLLSDCKTPSEVQTLQLKYPDWDIKLFADRIAELGGHK